MFPAFKANYTSLDSRRIRDQCNLQRSFSYQLERLYITVKVKVIGCMETYNEASLTDQEKVVVVRMACILIHNSACRFTASSAQTCASAIVWKTC
jgi:hypothetical protein